MAAVTERTIGALMQRTISVDEYHHLLETGSLMSGDPFELLEGRITEKVKGSPRKATAQCLVDVAVRASLPNGWHLRLQSAITLEDSEPEPDAFVVRGLSRDYAASLPSPPNIPLIVEIADSTLQHDRNTMGRIYARAGIPVYWIVNVVDEQIEVYSDPTGDVEEPHFRQRTDYRSGDQIPLVIDGKAVAAISADDLLP